MPSVYLSIYLPKLNVLTKVLSTECELFPTTILEAKLVVSCGAQLAILDLGKLGYTMFHDTVCECVHRYAPYAWQEKSKSISSEGRAGKLISSEGRAGLSIVSEWYVVLCCRSNEMRQRRV